MKAGRFKSSTQHNMKGSGLSKKGATKGVAEAVQDPKPSVSIVPKVFVLRLLPATDDVLTGSSYTLILGTGFAALKTRLKTGDRLFLQRWNGQATGRVRVVKVLSIQDGGETFTLHLEQTWAQSQGGSEALLGSLGYAPAADVFPVVNTVVRSSEQSPPPPSVSPVEALAELLGVSI